MGPELELPRGGWGQASGGFPWAEQLLTVPVLPGQREA